MITAKFQGTMTETKHKFIQFLSQAVETPTEANPDLPSVII